MAADLSQQTEEQAEGRDHQAPLQPDQSSRAQELGPSVEDDVRQPLGMKPVLPAHFTWNAGVCSLRVAFVSIMLFY